MIDRYLDVVDLLGRINPAQQRGHVPRTACRAGTGRQGDRAAGRADADAPAGRERGARRHPGAGTARTGRRAAARLGSRCRRSPTVDAPSRSGGPGRPPRRPDPSRNGPDGVPAVRSRPALHYATRPSCANALTPGDEMRTFRCWCGRSRAPRHPFEHGGCPPEQVSGEQHSQNARFRCGFSRRSCVKIPVRRQAPATAAGRSGRTPSPAAARMTGRQEWIGRSGGPEHDGPPELVPSGRPLG